MFVPPADLRSGSARRVLASLLSGWPCTRPELARRTGLSAMTVGKAADHLLAAGYLLEAPGDPSNAQGRPGRLLSPSPRPCFVAVELGVQRTSLYRLGLAGERAGCERVVLPMRDGPEAFRRAVDAARAPLGDEIVEAVLVSVPGVLDAEQPAIVFSPNLHWSEGPELLRSLGETFAAPVCAVQEAQALALGHLTAGQAPAHFLMVDLGDGVGSSIVAGGRLFGGPLPLSGEIGHTPIAGNDRRCGCGALGCIETLAGRDGLLRTAAVHLPGVADWAALTAALAGRPLPPWLLPTIDALAMVLAGALNLLGLRDVVAVGPVADLHPEVVPELGRRLAAHALLGRFGRVECRHAPERRQLGLLRAAIDRVLVAEPRRDD
jgi:predicted NBD/HSP70 family sugar kinase